MEATLFSIFKSQIVWDRKVRIAILALATFAAMC